MSEEPIGQHLTARIPENLDDIVRSNRDKCRLAFATDEEFSSLQCEQHSSVGGPVRHTLQDWNILMIHVTSGGSLVKSFPKLIGSVQATGQAWITSTVTGIDSRANFVKTQNSVYRVTGPRVFEPDMHLLLHVCVWLNQNGAGSYLGVPEFFY